MRRELGAALIAVASIGAGCDLLPTASHPECEPLAAEYGPGVRTVASFETTVGALRRDAVFGPPLEPVTIRDDVEGVLCYYDGDLPMPASDDGGPSTRAAVFGDAGGWSVLVSGDADEIPLRPPGG